MAQLPPFLNFNLNEGLEDTLLAGAAIAQYQRVYVIASGATVPTPLLMPANNATDLAIGTAQQAIANGNVGTVRLDAPMQFGLANTLINIGDTIYQANNGYVSATSVNNVQIGVSRYACPAPTGNVGNNAVPITIYQVKKSA
jgi:hypothetical protein